MNCNRITNWYVWHKGQSKRSHTKFSFKLLKKCSFNNFLKMNLLAAFLISSNGNSHHCLGNSDKGKLIKVASLTNGMWSWALFLRWAKSALFLLSSLVGRTCCTLLEKFWWICLTSLQTFFSILENRWKQRPRIVLKRRKKLYF